MQTRPWNIGMHRVASQVVTKRGKTGTTSSDRQLSTGRRWRGRSLSWNACPTGNGQLQITITGRNPRAGEAGTVTAEKEEEDEEEDRCE